MQPEKPAGLRRLLGWFVLLGLAFIFSFLSESPRSGSDGSIYRLLKGSFADEAAAKYSLLNGVADKGAF